MYNLRNNLNMVYNLDIRHMNSHINQLLFHSCNINLNKLFILSHLYNMKYVDFLYKQ